jgi:hypothetical protein
VTEGYPVRRDRPDGHGRDFDWVGRPLPGGRFARTPAAPVRGAWDDHCVPQTQRCTNLKASTALRCAFIAVLVAALVLTLLHQGSVGASLEIVGYAGLFAIAAREEPAALRTKVPAATFWAAVGVMAFLGAYVLANRT